MAEARKETRPIRRTIVIGVGGTGRDTLMRLRRLIIDKYGKLSEFPIVQFVHIDADKGASEVSGLSTGKNYIGQEIIFTQAEKVVTTMNGNEVNDLAKGLEDRGQYAPPSPYEHIKSWFPPQLRSNLKAIEDGASGVRPIGKVAYFHNFRKIKEAIKSADNRTIGHEGKMLRKNLIVEPGLNIFVVGSLCGGTGSGMCLDVGYTLRKLYSGTETKTIAYFVISPELYSDTPRMNASTYAALKELNHYSSESNKYETMYDPQYQDGVAERRPPFDYIFLLSNQTNQGHKILEKGKLCNIIAHKIYLDFADELSSILSASRDNFNSFLQNRDQHPRPNIQRFMTFGLAKIYFPRERIINICLNDIKKNIVNFWMHGEGQSPDGGDLLNKFLSLRNWTTVKSETDIFRYKLESAALEKNKTFNTTNKNWINSLLDEINQFSKKKEDREKIVEKLPSEFTSQFKKVQPGETENIRGIWLTKIKNSQKQVFENLKTDIDIFLNELLDPAYQDFSIYTSLSWLSAIRTWLEIRESELIEELKPLGNLHQYEDIEKILKNANIVFEDIESKKGWLFNINDKRPTSFKEEASNLVNNVNEILRDNFNYVLIQEAININKYLVGYVQNLIYQIDEFNSLLKNLLDKFIKKSTDIQELNNDEMNGEAIFTDEDIKEYFQILMPENEKRIRFNSLSNQSAEKANLEKQFVSFVLQKNIQEGQLQRIIDETVDEEFSTRSFNISKPVIRQFLQRHSLNDSRTRLLQILRESDPLLQLNTSSPFYEDTDSKKIKIVAYKNTNEREVEEFKSILNKDLGLKDNVFKEIQNDEEIIIVQEYAAFPLRIINNIEKMRGQYDLEKKYPSVHLHTDNRDFIDPVPPDENTTLKLQTLFYTCLALQELKKDSNNNYQGDYESEFGFIDMFTLSPVWSEAIDALIHAPKITKALEMIENKLIEDLKKNPEAKFESYNKMIEVFYNEVRSLSEGDPNYPERSILLDDGTQTNTKPPLLKMIFNKFAAIAMQAKENFGQNNPSKLFASSENEEDKNYVETTASEEDFNSDN
jgi:hypothetical protein